MAYDLEVLETGGVFFDFPDGDRQGEGVPVEFMEYVCKPSQEAVDLENVVVEVLVMGDLKVEVVVLNEVSL